MGVLPNHFYNFRCEFDDTAQYHASAMNVKEEISVYASLVVKSRLQNISFNISYFFLLRCPLPVLLLWLTEPLPLGDSDRFCLFLCRVQRRN